ncbi:MAG: HEAT repeat domain-containing protein, partial [Phycisphaerae bacterium]|nr:HEAT repeat domain-containing protein [Phycisphaerae bacterium]
AVRLIVRVGSFHLAYLLSAQLHHDGPGLAEAASRGLLALASAAETGPAVGSEQRPMEEDGLVEVGEGDTLLRRRQWLSGALVEAANCYHQHRRVEVLVAAATGSMRRDPELLAILGQRRGAAHRGLCHLLREAEDPRVAAASLALAGEQSLEIAAIEGLRSRGVRKHLPALIKRAHLVGAPRIRSAVRRVTEAQHLVPSPQMIAEASAPSARQIPRWLRSLYLPSQQRIAALAEVLDHTDRLSRLLALRGLMSQRHAEAAEQIAEACLDSDAAIAMCAIRWLELHKWDGLERLMIQLIHSPLEPVRRMAEQRLAPLGFDRFWANWSSWEKLDPEVRVTAGRALVKVNPRFQIQLGARLEEADPSDRLKAVMIVRQLDQVDLFQDRLLALVQDEDERVASAAARALGELPASPQAVAELHLALDHRDDRVRANAVESLEQMNELDNARDLLEQVAEGPGNRSRANAVKVLMQMPVGGAMTTLRQMLIDPDPDHRRSALWVVEQLRVIDTLDLIAVMARADDHLAVRRRALRLIRRVADAGVPAQHAAATAGGSAMPAPPPGGQPCS